MLFLCYFSAACLTAAALGFGTAKRCFQMSFSMNPEVRASFSCFASPTDLFLIQWNHSSPRLLVLLMEVLACVMGLAVSFMCASQVSASASCAQLGRSLMPLRTAPSCRTQPDEC